MFVIEFYFYRSSYFIMLEWKIKHILSCKTWKLEIFLELIDLENYNFSCFIAYSQDRSSFLLGTVIIYSNLFVVQLEFFHLNRISEQLEVTCETNFAIFMKKYDIFPSILWVIYLQSCQGLEISVLESFSELLYDSNGTTDEWTLSGVEFFSVTSYCSVYLMYWNIVE